MEGFVVIKIWPDGRVSLAINQVEADAIRAALESLKKPYLGSAAVQAAVVPGRLFGDSRFQLPDDE